MVPMVIALFMDVRGEHLIMSPMAWCPTLFHRLCAMRSPLFECVAHLRNVQSSGNSSS